MELIFDKPDNLSIATTLHVMYSLIQVWRCITEIAIKTGFAKVALTLF